MKKRNFLIVPLLLNMVFLTEAFSWKDQLQQDQMEIEDIDQNNGENEQQALQQQQDNQPQQLQQVPQQQDQNIDQNNGANEQQMPQQQQNNQPQQLPPYHNDVNIQKLRDDIIKLLKDSKSFEGIDIKKQIYDFFKNILQIYEKYLDQADHLKDPVEVEDVIRKIHRKHQNQEYYVVLHQFANLITANSPFNKMNDPRVNNAHSIINRLLSPLANHPLEEKDLKCYLDALANGRYNKKCEA